MQNQVVETKFGALYLSPVTSYCIRRLLRENFDRLKSVVKSGTVQNDPLADLNEVIKSLYLDADQVNSVVQDLERLTSCYQVLSSQKGSYHQELDYIRRQIFWLLGFKQETV